MRTAGPLPGRPRGAHPEGSRRGPGLPDIPPLQLGSGARAAQQAGHCFIRDGVRKGPWARRERPAPPARAAAPRGRAGARTSAAGRGRRLRGPQVPPRPPAVRGPPRPPRLPQDSRFRAARAPPPLAAPGEASPQSLEGHQGLLSSLSAAHLLLRLASVSTLIHTPKRQDVFKDFAANHDKEIPNAGQ